MENYDIGIIGGGPAGYSSAIYYAKQGKTVILFEKEYIGGTCLNKGCIPTKAFLHVADTYSQLKDTDKLGISFDNLTLDFKKVKEYKTNTVLKLQKGLELTLKRLGVTIINECAQIISKNVIKTKNSEYECSDIIIATGSKPKEIKGLEYDHNFILSSDDILELSELPKSILIVGSGAIGTEWSRIFSAFGVDVTIIELESRLCPLADWEVSKRIEREFKQKKIRFYTSTSVKRIDGQTVSLSNGEIIVPEKILAAVGREIIKPDNTYGVSVIGDATGEIMLAHYAVSQAKEMAFNIPFNKKIVPSVIYGSPEIAWVGEVSKSKEDDESYDKHFMLVSALGKSHCDNATDGFIKILSKNGEIKGASIFSKEASSLIQQIAISMSAGISIEKLKQVCFAHPTYSEGIGEVLL